jgi:hypothetical protein
VGRLSHSNLRAEQGPAVNEEHRDRLDGQMCTGAVEVEVRGDQHHHRNQNDVEEAAATDAPGGMKPPQAVFAVLIP